MSKEDERPDPRNRRRPPRPDPTEGQDPATPPATPAPARGRARRSFRTADTYVQLNTRIDPLLSELIEEVSSDRRWSKRDVVEEALKAAYPEEYRMAQERHHRRGSEEAF
ncbi:hypothetical protein GCM10009801_81920 [Streptomyces albiaxialis]|uniref:Ribbon-helix-helix protein CopG domain-containing protein n=1 Tax=Streptomyces albiaxialis TaxID=329523 RepID=A0ABN2X922_9ACTN